MADAMFAKPLFAEALFADGIVSDQLAAYEVRTWLLEARDNSGTLLGFLPDFNTGRWTEEANRPEPLTFDYPARESVCSNFVRPNQIWLRDYDSGTLYQKFRILDKTLTGYSNETYSVNCESLLGQLGEEWITEYEVTGATLSTIISGLLGFQDKASKIVKGTITPSLATSQNINARNKSILAAIEALHEEIGGYFWVDAWRRFHWQTNIGRDSGQQFRREKNMLGISEQVDYKNMATRVYAYGTGSNRTNRLNLTDAGEGQEYVKDASAESTYGIVARAFVDNTIEVPAQLLAKANYVLGLYKDPQYRYRIKLLDLAKDKRYKRSFEHVEIGSRVWLIDEQLGIETNQTVVKLTRNLDTTLLLDLELANTTKRASDFIAELAKRAVESEFKDTIGTTDWYEETPAALGPGAPGTALQSAHGDHEHPTTGLALSDHTHLLVAGATDVSTTEAELDRALSGASVNVTAANLNTLTAGAASDADALHKHPKYLRVFRQNTIPDDEDWDEGDVWVDTTQYYNDHRQMWAKTGSSNKVVALTVLEDE